LDCVGEGKLGDNTVSLHGGIGVSCSTDNAGSYQCQCQGATSKQIKVEAKEEWAACEQASTQCETLVTPGSNGGVGMGGGIALPGKAVPVAF
jgi:hypothetical protein